MGFKVIIGDHFSYMRKDAEYAAGVYASASGAIAKAKNVVDEELAHYHKPGMTYDDLIDMYSMYGEDPYIVTTAGDANPDFSALEYARERARAICAGG